MTESIFILLGIAIGVGVGHFLTEWSYERAYRRRSRLDLPGDRIVRRMK